jgi:hypothetical protein
MSGPQVKWELIADTSKSSRAVDQAITKSESLTGKLQGVGKGMVVGAGIAGFNLLTSAIDLGISKLGEAAEAFRADETSQKLLAQALQNNIANWNGNTAGVEAYATAQAKLGFADDEVRTSIGTLIGVTHDLTEAQKLNSLAQDLARAKGISLEQATDAVSKAAQGNGRALKSLGIDIAGATNAAGFLDAIQRNVTGSAETWAATNEGKLAVSNVKVGEAMERVGKIVNDVGQVAAPILAEALTVLVDVLGAVWEAIGPIVGSLVEKLQPAFRALGPLVGRVFGVIGNVVKSLAPVFEVVFGAIGTIISTQVAVWSALFDVLGGVLGVLGDAFRGVGRVVSAVFGAIAPIVRGAINFVIGAVNGIIRAINGLQIHVHMDTPVGAINFDWGGLNLPHLPYLHSGGVVPGAPGSDVLAVLQAGERVTPADARPGVVVNVYGNIVGPSGIEELTNMIAVRLRLDAV